ncbi:MAG TPA: papain-like cysteine protease family protein [Actinoplanes sp.]|nr:papain-like cysteine protease family protein [Actinoplanes sp.]
MEFRSVWARLLAVVALAAGLILVGGPAQGVEKTLGITKYKQEKTNWCWAAATKTIVKYQTGTVIAQCSIVKRGRAVSTCNNVSGSKTQVRRALNYYGVNPGTEETLTWDRAKSEIIASRPIYSSIRWRSGGGHAHVIHGYYNTGYSWGVSYLDPYTGKTVSKEWGSYLSNSEWTTGTALIHLYKK